MWNCYMLLYSIIQVQGEGVEYTVSQPISSLSQSDLSANQISQPSMYKILLNILSVCQPCGEVKVLKQTRLLSSNCEFTDPVDVLSTHSASNIGHN